MNLKNLLIQALGVGVVLFGFYAIILIVQVLFGDTKTWGDVATPVLVAGGLFALIILGYFFGDKDKDETTSNTIAPTEQKVADGPKKYDPLVDVLEFTVYKQSLKSYWHDNDGDYHHGQDHHAYLRFYEDGTVLATRLDQIPRKENENSYTYKGSFSVQEDGLQLQLDKVNEANDVIDVYLSPEERRTMKYAGFIASDEDLIKAGSYTGLIRAAALSIGNHEFYKLPMSEMIITASEETCDEITQEMISWTMVSGTSQHTGNWYTNGETGPEWFTVHVKVPNEKIDAFKKAYNEANWSVSNTFWS